MINRVYEPEVQYSFQYAKQHGPGRYPEPCQVNHTIPPPSVTEVNSLVKNKLTIVIHDPLRKIDIDLIWLSLYIIQFSTQDGDLAVTLN